MERGLGRWLNPLLLLTWMGHLGIERGRFPETFRKTIAESSSDRIKSTGPFFSG